MVDYRGEKFSGYNKPKKTPGHPTKSHVVLAKDGDQVRMIRFGQQGVSGSPRKSANRPRTENGVSRSRLAMQRILPRVRCLQPIGRT